MNVVERILLLLSVLLGLTLLLADQSYTRSGARGGSDGADFHAAFTNDYVTNRFGTNRPSSGSTNAPGTNAPSKR